MRRLSILLSVVLTVLVLVPAASAEWFADAYLGPAITSSSTLTFTTFGEEQKQSLNGRSSPLFGLRFGRWLEDFDLPWLGVAADVSYFYVGLGGALFFSNLDGAIGFQEGSDTSADVGLDTRVGVAFMIDSNWAAFTEYRFTHVAPTWDVKVFGGTTPASTTFNTHHVILGLSYRF